MNASISMGVSAPNPLQALARLLSSGTPSHAIPLAPRNPSAQILQIIASETGLVAYRNGSPVAWIAPGYHDGQADLKPLRCDFVDVAYIRQNRCGINLETHDFDTLEEAIDFVNSVCGGAV